MKTSQATRSLIGCAVMTSFFLTGAPAIADASPDVPNRGAKNRLPAFIRGEVSRLHYDGISDDLLTAGLGKSGLAGAAPGFADALLPTAAELRRSAIYNNYRALVDISAGGGYGSLYGPNVDADGNVTADEGLIAGTEWIAYADSHRGRTVVMVQIPDHFDVTTPCIVTAPSSGSRGIYGAIGTSGEWGLKRGCAVAYTDKGTGTGLHELSSDTVNLIDGTRADAAIAGDASHFTAALDDAERAAFLAEHPHRVAYKHAHSQDNPERDWGLNVLQSVVFAFYAINEQYGKPGPQGLRARFDKRNTLVIAAGVSNGGGAAVAAAERDKRGLIDGVAVTEPNVQAKPAPGTSILQGVMPIEGFGKTLIDYFTLGNLYQPCAALAPSAASAPALAFLPAALAANRCAGLHDKGLLTADTLVGQAEESLAMLHSAGWQPEHDLLHASHYRFATNAIAVTYANTYTRAGVTDNLCGYSFANTDAAGAPAAQNPVLLATAFGTSNGIPPAPGTNIVYNDSLGGPRLDLLAVSPSTGSADLALDGALCHRSLLDISLAQDTGLHWWRARLAAGVRQVLLEGDLRRKPALIVHGRSDTLLPVNHTSRPYYVLNQVAERRHSRLSYIEVTHAQHFDAFIGSPFFAGYDTMFVPLHVYLNRALDAMWTHLMHGTPLPPSQVVHTLPRGGAPGAAPPITEANVPAWQATPGPAQRIVYERRQLSIPE